MAAPSVRYLLAHEVMVAEWLHRREFAEREWNEDREGYLHARALKAMLLALRYGGEVPEEDPPELVGHHFSWPGGQAAMVLEIDPGRPARPGEAYLAGVFWGGGQPARYRMIEQGSGRRILSGRSSEGAHFNYGEWTGELSPAAFAEAVRDSAATLRFR